MEKATPKYLELVQWINEQIEMKKLVPGQKMYSENTLKDMLQITIKWDIRSAEAERLFHSKRYEVPLLLRVNQFPSYLYRSSPDDRYDAYR